MKSKKLKGNEGQNKRQAYGLLTCITMIVGIVIGSGIFYKADNMLINTGGSINKTLIALAIGAFGIVFGSLTLSEFALRTKTNGGFVAYYEKNISKRSASGFAWFQTFLYYPSLSVVIAWVGGIYTLFLFDVGFSLVKSSLLGLAYLTCFCFGNTFSRKSGGIFQNLSTFLKLIPLFVVAIVALFMKQGTIATDNAFLTSAGIDVTSASETLALMQKNGQGAAWLAALPAIAFSYDGWIIATTIAPEVRNPKKNLRLAFIIAPILIFTIYVLYVFGVWKLLGTKFFAVAGDKSINYAITAILTGGEPVAHSDMANVLSKIIQFVITISILGVLNGVIMGGIRMPQSLASKGMMPDSTGKIATIHPKFQISLNSSFTFYAICLVYFVIHYFTQKHNVFNGGDISEIAIVFSYTIYIVLYLKVMQLTKKGVFKNKFTGYITPVLAIVGSLVILVGQLILAFKYAVLFLAICSVIYIIGAFYYDYNQKSQFIERLKLRVSKLEKFNHVEDDTLFMYQLENIDDDDEEDELEKFMAVDLDARNDINSNLHE